MSGYLAGMKIGSTDDGETLGRALDIDGLSRGSTAKFGIGPLAFGASPVSSLADGLREKTVYLEYTLD